jgi:hypothetical protein
VLHRCCSEPHATAQHETQDGIGQNLPNLGREYVALAISQYRQNRIDENQLADYLDTKPKNLAGIEDYFARGSA